MKYTSQHGIVGVIKPTMRPGSLEEFIRLMPEGVGVIPMFIGFNQGTKEEFAEGLSGYHPKVAELAELGATIIHPEGGPPLMLSGVIAEQKLTQLWEHQFGVPVITSGQTQIEALKILNARKIVATSYLSSEVNAVVANYFTEAGFEMATMKGISTPFMEAGNLSTEQIYLHTKQTFLEHPGADYILLFGSGWRSLDVIHLLEEDLNVPVVHSVAARVWSIQSYLNINVPVKGYGYLLETMPRK